MRKLMWPSAQSCETALEVRKTVPILGRLDLPHVMIFLGPCLFNWETKSAGLAVY